MTHEHGDPVPDLDLLARCRLGDAVAFDEIVRRHRLAVYRVARRILGSHEDADDAVQETFVRAWRGVHGFRGDSALRTWLVRIALNVGRTMGADRARSVALDETALTTDGAPGAEGALARDESAAYVRKAVSSLPPRQREVVALKVFSEMTYEEVAFAMGLTVGAVKAHLHQAVSNLRRRMAPDGGAP